MRNPSRTAAICAVLIAIAAVSGWIAWHRYHASGADWLVIVLFAVTVVIAPYAPVLQSLGNAAVPMAVTMIAGGVAIVAAIIGVATLRMRPKAGGDG